ncbi:glycosyltransferase family 2 protein [Candidatus Woesearchaeota archaeon]|nr:glycosyltransferase family 2 protein [Candidatus Woesearchaeota archaeon]
MEKGLVSVIIPGYNEEATVGSTIPAVEKALSSAKRRFEILVVDDGSTDKTAEILERLAKSKEHPKLRFISYKNGPSRRENLAKSFRLLNGEYVLLLDMDLSLDVRHLKDMLYWLDQGYELVIPNRYHTQSTIKRNLRRYAISKAYNALIRLLFRTGLKDNICGFKAFRHDTAMNLVNEAGTDPTGKRSVFWDTQLLIIAKKNRIRVKEIPVHWEENEKSTLNFRRESGMLPYMIKFWLQQRKKG